MTRDISMIAQQNKCRSDRKGVKNIDSKDKPMIAAKTAQETEQTKAVRRAGAK